MPRLAPDFALVSQLNTSVLRTNCSRSVMSLKSIIALAFAGSVLVSTCSAQTADAVVSYNPGTGFSAGFTNVSTALGAPSLVDPYGYAIDPFDPPYLKTQLLSLGTGGSVVLKFNKPIINHPKN